MRLKALKSHLVERKFLSLLILLLLIIAVTTIKPQYYFAGWDNYSSNLNPQMSLERAFFSTWRDYRGLGVPSDSESTDIPRILFFVLLKPFLPLQILDQVYYVLALAAGALGMYFLIYYLLTQKKDKLRTNIDTLDNHAQMSIGVCDFIAFVGAFFYLFNLNTLSVFYFPIFPFTARFFGLPLTVLAYLKLLNGRNENGSTIRNLFFFMLALLLAMPSNIIGTVFVTLGILLALISFSNWNFKRVLLGAILVVTVNAFWLLPFANYTIQKSHSLRIAPTFIEANEAQLNKSKGYHSLKQQAVLFPSFFETGVKSLDNMNSTLLHPLAENMTNPLHRAFLYIFPLLYLCSSAYLLIKFKQHTRFIWAPLTTLLFLALSMKEYSPVGFIYIFLNKLTPLFGVLFRFGDTKLHPYIAFAGSITISLGIFALLQTKLGRSQRLWHTKANAQDTTQTALHPKTYVKLSILTILAGTLLVYNTYFTGNLLGYFTYNKIPDAYFNIAQRIKADSVSNGQKALTRAIHLPYDKDVYWRSYDWGYIGSQFLGYILENPLLEKTFEPASMENAYVNEETYELIKNSQYIKNETEMTKRAEKLYNLYFNSGVEYIIFDETVKKSSVPRGIVFWGEFDTSDTQTILDEMKELGLVTEMYSENVEPRDYIDTYKKIFDVNETTTNTYISTRANRILVYKLKEAKDKISFLPKVSVLKDSGNNLYAQHIQMSGAINQDSQEERNFIETNVLTDSVYLPLRDKGTRWEDQRNKLITSIDIPAVGVLPGSRTLKLTAPSPASSDSSLLEIYASKSNNLVNIYINRVLFPKIQQQSFLQEVGTISFNVENFEQQYNDGQQIAYDWHILEVSTISNYRIRVENTVLPLPFDLEKEPTPIGHVTVHSNNPSIELLQFVNQEYFNSSEFSLTSEPNCTLDKKEDYVSSLDTSNQNISVWTKNGSTCLWRGIEENVKDADYIEMQFNAGAESKDLNKEYPAKLPNTSKPKLRNFVSDLPKPIVFEICIKEGDVSRCLNKHKLLKLQEAGKFVVPIGNNVSTTQNLIVLATIKTDGYQEINANLSNFSISRFENKGTVVANIPSVDASAEYNIYTENTQKLLVELPKALSDFSFYLNPEIDAYYASNTGCHQNDKGYLTNRALNFNWISYVENCTNGIFQEVAFSSENFYISALHYNKASGKQPKIYIQDDFINYYDKWASLHTGYPEIPGFNSFQNPEIITTRQQVSKKFNPLTSHISFDYIYPSKGIFDYGFKQLKIQQYSENEGLLSIGKLELIEIPENWQNMVLAEGIYFKEYEVPSNVEYTKILPSLYKVEATIGTSGTQKYLLDFNEGYDEQWNIYSKVTDALWGKEISNTQHRCNGLTNCFEITFGQANSNTNNGTFYLFYWPEVLAFAGYSILTLTLVIVTTATVIIRIKTKSKQ